MANAADIGLIMLISIPILLAIGVPISIAMGIGSVAAMTTIFGFDRMAITAAQRVFAGINSFSLLAIPFFVLAGIIMTNGGIAQRLINFAKAVIWFIPGALIQDQHRGQHAVWRDQWLRGCRCCCYWWRDWSRSRRTRAMIPMSRRPPILLLRLRACLSHPATLSSSTRSPVVAHLLPLCSLPVTVRAFCGDWVA